MSQTLKPCDWCKEVCTCKPDRTGQWPVCCVDKACVIRDVIGLFGGEKRCLTHDVTADIRHYLDTTPPVNASGFAAND